MPARLDITLMQGAASHYGGKCLSKEYNGAMSPLTWMCSKGHTWSTYYHIIKQGGWCPQCVKGEKQKDFLEKIRNIAEKKGGKCLSETYINSGTRLVFQCSEEHIWKALPNDIIRGWCKVCNREKRNAKKLDSLKLIAKNKNGLCLSSTYINKTHKLKWQCEHDHTWKMAAVEIKEGYWCPECRISSVKDKVFKDVSAIAEKSGGRCLSLAYKDKATKMKWQCHKGHVWMALAQQIRAGHWCPECAIEKRKSLLTKYTIEMLQQHAKKRNGKLLSTKYIQTGIPLKWQCDKGHTWSARVYSIIYENSWCRLCFHKSMKLSIEEFQELAAKKNGLLLSKQYVTIDTPLKWQCAEGHKWLATPGNIKHGTWCPKCYANKRKKIKV